MTLTSFSILKLTNMNKLFLFLILCFISQQTYSQRAVCRPGLTEKNIQSKSNETALGTNGAFIRMKGGSDAGYSFKDGNQLTSLLFSGAIWVGGKDSAGNLKLAGTTYASLNDNFDWFPGPLEANGQTDEPVCKVFDRIFSVSKDDILEAFINVYNADGTINSEGCDKIPLSLQQWPARGNPFWDTHFDIPLYDQELAAFYDNDGDGLYNPCKGDLPVFDNNLCLFNVKDLLNRLPDQMHFWVVNDNGSVHRLTAGDAMQMEVHNYMFSFIGEGYEDMTFYKFKCINRSDSDLNDAFLSLWMDPDLGCYQDDYIGTISKENMMFVYNQDAIDGSSGETCQGGTNTFGNEIPMLGISFLKGFKAFKNDGNGGFTSYDSGLTSSMYTNNCGAGSFDPVTCDPADRDNPFYYLMQGKWITSDVMTKGGTGYNPASTDTTLYVYDGNPANPNDWTMCSTASALGDRRILMSTGGVTLKPGEGNEAIVAITLARNVSHPCPDVSRIVKENQKAKQLFRDCWQHASGPSAPEITSSSIKEKITLKFSNDYASSNNKNYSYSENINYNDLEPGIFYKFEGYKIYQVNNYNFDVNNLDQGESVLIYNSDLDNGIKSISNWTLEESVSGSPKWVQKLKVEGNDSNVLDSFIVDHDFLLNEPLQHGKKYYFVAVAYAYNNYLDFDPTTQLGQQRLYLEGQQNVKVHEAILDKTNKIFDPIITRLAGQGNQNSLTITAESREKILNGTDNGKVTYETGKGPFSIYITDDSKIDLNKKYQLKIIGPTEDAAKICNFKNDDTYLELTDIESGQTIKSTNPISLTNQNSFNDLGFKILLGQTLEPGDIMDSNYGMLSQTYDYRDINKPKWLDAIKDVADEFSTDNLRELDPYNNFSPNNKNDQSLFYPLLSSKIGFPDFNPNLISPLSFQAGPVSLDATSGTLRSQDLNNVDLVFTSDKSKWSRCIVIETAQSNYVEDLGLTTIGNCKMMEVRTEPSIGKDGNADNSGTTGLSWFPGYAIDVETGRRLNVFFGENSVYRLLEKNNVTDMIFNPTSELIDSNLIINGRYLPALVAGGQHYIYVTRQDYDECAQLATILKKGTSAFSKRNPIGAITWTCMPLLSKDADLLSINDGLIPNDLVVNLRVNNPYNHERKLSDIAMYKTCTYDNEPPTYEFRFVKKDQQSNVTTPLKSTSLCAFKADFSGFNINDVKEDVFVEVMNTNGYTIDKFDLRSNEHRYWEASKSQINNQMVFVKIKSKKTGQSLSHKSVIMW